MKNEDLKSIVKEKYSIIANQSKSNNASSCCGSSGCCGEVDYSIFSDDYTHIDGYNEEADLGLGCGIPTDHAEIKPGDSVLDLGSGAGNDCFVARSLVGENGKVTGIDFTDAMIDKANANNTKMGYSNVHFVKGDIENMPFDDNSFDVIISNCVLNLVPDKRKAFKEMYRTLKPGGHFCVSDVVIIGDLPEKLEEDAEMYAGCVSGAIQKNAYMDIIDQNNFSGISIKKEKEIKIPDQIMLKYMSLNELRTFKKVGKGIYSITVFAKKT